MVKGWDSKKCNVSTPISSLAKPGCFDAIFYLLADRCSHCCSDKFGTCTSQQFALRPRSLSGNKFSPWYSMSTVLGAERHSSKTPVLTETTKTFQNHLKSHCSSIQAPTFSHESCWLWRKGVICSKTSSKSNKRNKDTLCKYHQRISKYFLQHPTNRLTALNISFECLTSACRSHIRLQVQFDVMDSQRASKLSTPAFTSCTRSGWMFQWWTGSHYRINMSIYWYVWIDIWTCTWWLLSCCYRCF